MKKKVLFWGALIALVAGGAVLVTGTAVHAVQCAANDPIGLNVATQINVANGGSSVSPVTPFSFSASVVQGTMTCDGTMVVSTNSVKASGPFTSFNGKRMLVFVKDPLGNKYLPGTDWSIVGTSNGANGGQTGPDFPNGYKIYTNTGPSGPYYYAGNMQFNNTLAGKTLLVNVKYQIQNSSTYAWTTYAGSDYQVTVSGGGGGGGISNPSCTVVASPSTGSAPLSTTFQITGTGGSAPYSYQVNFGDGSPQSTPGSSGSVYYTYSSAGTYTAVVTMLDAGEKQATCQTSVTVQSGGGPAPTCPSGEVTLSQSSVAVGGTVSISQPAGWFGGSFSSQDPSVFSVSGSSGTGVAVGTTYVAGGGWTASNGAAGCMLMPTEVTVTATNPPAGSLTASAVIPSSAQINTAVSFSSTVSGGTAPYTYAWSFGDGGSSTQAGPFHTYTKAGTYAVSMTVSDSSNPQLTATQNGSVVVSTTPPPPSGTLTASALIPATGVVGQAVSFSSTVSGGTAPYTYAWSFGDGGSSTQASPSYTYAQAGTYAVSVTVSDSSNPQLTATQNGSVVVSVGQNGGNFTCSITAPSSVSAGSSFGLSAQTSGGASPYMYTWDFGDGLKMSSYNATMSHTYTYEGSYAVNLSVTDSQNSVCTANANVSVINGSDKGSIPVPDVWIYKTCCSGPQVTLQWIKTLANASAVNIYRLAITSAAGQSPAFSESYLLPGGQNIPVNTGKFVDTTVQPGVPYAYWVKAFNSSDQQISKPAYAVIPTQCNLAPSAPSASDFTVTMQSCYGTGLRWKDVNQGSGFGIQATDRGEGQIQTIFYQSASSDPSTLSDTSNRVYSGVFCVNMSYPQNPSQSGRYCTTFIPSMAGQKEYIFAKRVDTGVQGGSVDSCLSDPVVAQVPLCVSALTCQISPSSQSGVAGDSLPFVSGIAGGTAPYSSSWDFGDGTPAQMTGTAQVNHSYASDGSYAVTDTVTDIKGVSTSCTASAQVGSGVPPQTPQTEGMSGESGSGLRPQVTAGNGSAAPQTAEQLQTTINQLKQQLVTLMAQLVTMLQSQLGGMIH